ncbi:DUF2178 domain-containing protein [Bifidobacterium eulemuris]|uniref:DUF2178 domain-containing protein n=1 Tax=Bifidobacterium eulemuris TaxID=1765219 RepID=A0A261G9P4_9BIFI|nr:DUF2178 domain-containing protein [Bifidobacterium eulemuris]OZG68139.1 hypothetical protein BEUL_1152 [Bifidobacterium eulemuris]QOL31796.1 DUF2178 domain-containing protein [Bifidobacterium eulemuris]
MNDNGNDNKLLQSQRQNRVFGIVFLILALQDALSITLGHDPMSWRNIFPMMAYAVTSVLMLAASRSPITAISANPDLAEDERDRLIVMKTYATATRIMEFTLALVGLVCGILANYDGSAVLANISGALAIISSTCLITMCATMLLCAALSAHYNRTM